MKNQIKIACERICLCSASFFLSKVPHWA